MKYFPIAFDDGAQFAVVEVLEQGDESNAWTIYQGEACGFQMQKVVSILWWRIFSGKYFKGIKWYRSFMSENPVAISCSEYTHHGHEKKTTRLTEYSGTQLCKNWTIS